MAVDSALLTKIRTLAAKIETTTGTPIAIASGDGAVNVFDSNIKANIPPNERKGQGSLSPLIPVPGAYSGKATFKTEVVGGATAFWLAVLVASCGFTGSGGVFTPLSGASATATIAQYINGRLKKIAGAMGKFSIDFETGKPAMVSFEYDGVWVPPTATALLVPTYPATAPPRFAGATLTIGGTTYRIGKMTIAVDNTVALRKDAANANNSGYHAACITDRKITVKVDPEALPLGTQDWNAAHLASTPYALSCIMNGGTGNTIAFAAPAMVLLNAPDDEDDNGILKDSLEFLCTQGSGPDTELSITGS